MKYAVIDISSISVSLLVAEGSLCFTEECPGTHRISDGKGYPGCRFQ